MGSSLESELSSQPAKPTSAMSAIIYRNIAFSLSVPAQGFKEERNDSLSSDKKCRGTTMPANGSPAAAQAIQRLGDYFLSFAAIPQSELQWFLSQVCVRRLEPGEVFIRTGDRPDRFGFVIRGYLHNVYETDVGRQFTQTFQSPGGLTGAYSAMLDSTPARFTTRAINSADLIIVRYKTVRAAYERHPVWDRAGRLIAEREFRKREEREYALLCLTPADRYAQLCALHPDLVQEVPQYLIASYLGVTAASLSRIRARRARPSTAPPKA